MSNDFLPLAVAVCSPCGSGSGTSSGSRSSRRRLYLRTTLEYCFRSTETLKPQNLKPQTLNPNPQP